MTDYARSPTAAKGAGAMTARPVITDLGHRRSSTSALPSDLAAKDALLLLARASSPARVAKLTRSQVVSALRAPRRRQVDAKADLLLTALRRQGLRQPTATEGAYAAIVVGQVGVITALNEQIAQLQEVVAEHFGRHPAADIYLSQPGLGGILAARTLGEFGDDPKRFIDARARKITPARVQSPEPPGRRPWSSPDTPPITDSQTRYTRRPSPQSARHQAPAYYDELRAREIGHHAALRQLANRLVGILHGCLNTNTRYDENTAWQHRTAAAA